VNALAEQPLPRFLTQPKLAQGLVQLVSTYETSDQGVAFIQSYERFVPTVYLDQGKLPTIGWGHLIKPGEKFEEPMTRETGDALFRVDLKETERAVLKLFAMPLAQHQFDALVSFAFNVGTGALQRSTLRQMILHRMEQEVPYQFLRWNKVQGKVSNGLTRRRVAEAIIYTQGVYVPN